MYHSLTKFIHGKLFKGNEVKGVVVEGKGKEKGKGREFIFALNLCRKMLDSFLQLWQFLIQLWQ